MEGIQKKNERITEEVKKKLYLITNFRRLLIFFKKKNIKQEINPNS